MSVRERVAIWWLSRKLKSQEVRMSPFWRKTIVSLIYAVAGLTAIAPIVLADGKIEGAEWGVIITALVTGWGKFSSNTTVVAPARKGETVTNFGPDAQ